jgi:hypothetical protein
MQILLYYMKEEHGSHAKYTFNFWFVGSYWWIMELGMVEYGTVKNVSWALSLMAWHRAENVEFYMETDHKHTLKHLWNIFIYISTYKHGHSAKVLRKSGKFKVAEIYTGKNYKKGSLNFIIINL